MLRVKPLWRTVLSIAIFAVLAVLAFVGTETFLWIPLMLLAVFLFAVNLHGIDKRKLSGAITNNEKTISYGVLGDYDVDKTPSSGLFIRLRDRPVFVDIKQDRLADIRRTRAIFLYQHQEELDRQLVLFVAANPRFAKRSIQYIGLHAENVEQCEVFWEPDGYTLLKNVTFTN
jgi:hypothetical protein